MEFYYTKDCDICDEKKVIVDSIEQQYYDNITLSRYLVTVNPENENHTKWKNYGFNYVPCVVVKNSSSGKYTMFRHYEINEKGVECAIDKHSVGGVFQKPKIVLDAPFNGFVNIPIVFNASSCYHPEGDEIVLYEWDLGIKYEDSVYGATVNKSYRWEGNYTITLIIKDSNGLVDRVKTYASITEKTVNNENNDNNSSENEQNTDTPGFEIILSFFAITIILFYKKRK
jgi:hypothetical protein